MLSTIFRSNLNPAVAPAFALTASLKGVRFGVRRPRIDLHARGINDAHHMHRNKPKPFFNCPISGSMAPISNEVARKPEAPGRFESESPIHDLWSDANHSISLVTRLDAYLKHSGSMTPVETIARASETTKEFDDFVHQFSQITGLTVRYLTFLLIAFNTHLHD